MEKVRLAVYDNNMQPLIDVLHRSYEPDYTRQLSEHYLFISERYNLLLRYQVTINVVIERAEDMLIIDIVGIGGSQSFLGIWGKSSPYKNIKRLANTIVSYCNENNIKGKQVKGESTF